MNENSMVNMAHMLKAETYLVEERSFKWPMLDWLASINKKNKERICAIYF